jgi:hypothetical protein
VVEIGVYYDESCNWVERHGNDEYDEQNYQNSKENLESSVREVDKAMLGAL